eukprot:gene33140-42862_t
MHNDTAVNLFNSYLQAASQSPRVIAASRPSSPVPDIAQTTDVETSETIVDNDNEFQLKSEDNPGTLDNNDGKSDVAVQNTEIHNKILIHDSSAEELSTSSSFKKKRRKKGKRMTVRRSSPTSPLRGSHSPTRSVISPPKTGLLKAPSSRRSSRPTSTVKVKGHDGLVMENLMPVYSDLVHGIFKRPIIVSILTPQDKDMLDFMDAIRSHSPVSPISADRSKIIAFSAMQHDRHHELDGTESLTEADFIEKHHINRIPRRKTNFLIKVYDLVESKEAMYEVGVKYFLKLKFDFKHPEYFPMLKVYYKPQYLSWWAKNMKHFIIIYEKPTSELSVSVDKKLLQAFLTKRIKHHLWMQSTVNSGEQVVPAYAKSSQGMKSRPGTSPSMVRFDTGLSMGSIESYDDDEVDLQSAASPPRSSRRTNAELKPFSYWKSIEDYYFSLSLADKVGKNWDMMMKIFQPMDDGMPGSQIIYEDDSEKKIILSDAWEKLDAMFRNTPASEKGGSNWVAAEKVLTMVRESGVSSSPTRTPRKTGDNPNSPLRVQTANSGVGEEDKQDLTKKKKKGKKAKKSDGMQKSVGSLPPLLQQGSAHSLLTKSSFDSTSSGKISSPTRRGRLSPMVVHRVKTAPLDELRSEVVTAIDDTLKPPPMPEAQLGPKKKKKVLKDSRENNKAKSATTTNITNTTQDVPSAIDLLEMQSQSQSIASVDSLSEDEIDSVGKEFSRTFPILADKVGQAVSPSSKHSDSTDAFQQSLSKEPKNPRKKEVIDIILKARKQVRNSKEFISRKISDTELKLLNSPFSQKLVREPKIDALMSDLSIDSTKN